MKNLIFLLVKFLLGILTFVFGFLGMAVLFVIALPLAGWNKSKYIFKRIPKQRTQSHSRKKKCICNDIGKHSPGGRCEACHSKKKDGGTTFKI